MSLLRRSLRRTRAVLGRSAESIALAAIFVAASGTGFVLHADVAATRRLAAWIANEALSGMFKGKLVVGDVTKLEIGRHAHVRAKQVSVIDPEGHPAIVAKDVEGRIDLERLLRSLLRGHAPEIAIEEARVDDVDVVIELDEHSDPSIARAFAAKTPSPPKPAWNGEAPKDTVRLYIPTARVRHAHAHGHLQPAAAIGSPETLDADADDIAGALRLEYDVLRIEDVTARVNVRAPKGPSQSAPLVGVATGGLSIPLATGTMTATVDLKGNAAGVPLTAHLGLDKSQLDVTVDVPKVAPEVVTRAFPLVPVARPVEIHAKASGTLPNLVVEARADVGDGVVIGKGKIGLAEKQPFSFDADLVGIDAASVTGPDSNVTARFHADGVIDGGAPAGAFKLAARVGTVAGVKTPAITAEGTFDDKHVVAKIHAEERGLVVDADATLDIPTQKITFVANARSNDLRVLARAPNVVAGSVTARATGTVDLAKSTITGRLTADGTDVAPAGASAARAHVEATVSGPLSSPQADVTVEATDVALQTDDKEPLLYPAAKARAHVSFLPTPRITKAEVTVDGREPGTAVTLAASEINVGNGAIVVRGGKVTGLGAPFEIEAQTAPGGGITVKARGEGIDMKRAASMTGIQELKLLPESTRAAVDIDVKSDARSTDGHIDVVLTADGGTSGEVHALLDGRKVHARARVAIPSVGYAEVSRAELELPGPPSAKTVVRATGFVDVRGAIDLEQGASLFAGDIFRELHGIATFSARGQRFDPSLLPVVSATVSTRGLDMAIDRGDAEPLHIGGVDGSVHVSYDPVTDETSASLVTWDDRGLFGSTDVKSKVPIVAWIRGEKTFDKKALGDLELTATADVAERNVDHLPGTLARSDLRGTLLAHLETSGKVARPDVRVHVVADGLREKRQQAGQPRYAPIDGTFDGKWDGEHIILSLAVDENERHRQRDKDKAPDDDDADPATSTTPANRQRTPKKPGHVRALVLGRLPMRDLLDGNAPRWNASAEIDIEDLELAPLPLPYNARGAVTARAKIRDLNGSPSLDAKVHVAGLGVSGARVSAGDIVVRAKSGSLSANAKITQQDGGSGKVDVQSSALTWKGTDIAWDAKQSTRVEYLVSGMRLSILKPLVRRSIPEIDGRVDGAGTITVDEDKQSFEGGIALSEGRFYANALGEELTNVSALARFDTNGVFRIQDATGRVGAGEVKASVSGRMKGFSFEAAEAVVVVPSKDGVPVSSEGATFAEATGEVRLSAKMAADRKALLVDVAVPRARAELPDRGTQSLQSLDPDDTIAIGIRRKDGTLEAAPLKPPARNAPDPNTQPLKLQFGIVLGDEVYLEGRGLRLSLSGKTMVEVAQEVAVTGQIQLKSGGTIDVQGRKFIVDRGTVTFDGPEPGDPTVIAAAYWDAPDRTRIWVEFSGPLKTGKLVLRSEPPYSKNEILSILLFGRPDPNMASGGQRQTGADQAGQIGGGVAAAGLNKALGELSDDVDLEQDRTSANRTRTKIGYRLRRNLKVQLGYAQGFSQREPDTTFLFLEWQFVPKWSLIGTRGDKGTSILDVLFQHRY